MNTETELPKVGHYGFLAEPFHCDFQNRLFVGHLGNHMLNAADYHSNDRGYGMHYLNTINKTWVLSRLSIELDSLPMAYDRFYVETWVEGAMRFFTSRDFKIGADDGTTYGYGRSVWAMIDTETRQPTDILKVNDGLISHYVDRSYPCPIAGTTRVPVSIADTEKVRSIDTYYNDVDVNGHINSVKYIEHVLDLWNLDWYRQYRLHRFDIAYVAEAHQGDRLNLYVRDCGTDTAAHPGDMASGGEKHYNVVITKTPAGGGKDVEVVRSSVFFVKV